MPDHCHGDLLREACIGVADRANVRERLTLPGVLARCCDPGRSLMSFTAVQAHQAHAWHAFLVQLAAMVCQRAGVGIADDACRRAAWWEDRLLALADGCAEAWCLVVEDRGKPAFMQVPVNGESKDYKKILKSPRQLDILVTSRNHDAKTARGEMDHWLFALVTLQTQQGYLGAKNYGIFRMNSGYGNRFAVGYADPGNLNAWFMRDVTALLIKRSTTVQGGGFASQNGMPLLWTIAWDGMVTSSLNHSQLDPWCIEICRRIRLEQTAGIWFAKQASSNAERTTIIKDKKDKWVVQNGFADPWMAQKNAKASAPSEHGFTAKKTVEYLLDPETTVPPTQQIQEEDIGNDLHWYGRTLVRGECETNGWHERLVPIPANVRRHWRDKPEMRSVSAERARSQLEDASSLNVDVLRSALRVLYLTAGFDKKTTGKAVEKWASSCDLHIDAAFFPHLWDHLDDDKDAASRSWRRLIIALAKATLSQAQATVPDGVRRWRALADSQRRFNDGLKSNPSRADSFSASLREPEPDAVTAPPSVSIS